VLSGNRQGSPAAGPATIGVMTYTVSADVRRRTGGWEPQYLGTVAAESWPEAERLARERWPEYGVRLRVSPSQDGAAPRTPRG